jgi:hypothetical protein
MAGTVIAVNVGEVEPVGARLRMHEHDRGPDLVEERPVANPKLKAQLANLGGTMLPGSAAGSSSPKKPKVGQRTANNAPWPDDMPVPAFEPRMVCTRCARRRRAAELAGAAGARERLVLTSCMPMAT